MENTKPCDYFNEIVGQENVKRKLSFFLDGYQKTSMIPNLIFFAEKGSGKSLFANKIAKNLTVDGLPKRAKEINCTSIKSVVKLCENILLPFVQGNCCTLFFDEASELRSDVGNALLTILNPNKSNTNTFSCGDLNFDIDFKKHSFIFATTDPQKVIPALINRCHRIDLEPYKDNELMDIVKKNIDLTKVTFDDKVVEEIPTVLRHNPRCAQMMATDIFTYCMQYGVKVFDVECWNKLKKHLNIKPNGLNVTEIRILQKLQLTPNCRLTDLAASMGMSTGAIQRDGELYLLRENLMKVSGGRSLTASGTEYLKELSKTS